MKLYKIIFFTCIFLLSTTTTQAQFWKKIGKKIEKAAERTIERKVEEKTERSTENAMDSILNADKKLKKRKKNTGDRNSQTANESEQNIDYDTTESEAYNQENTSQNNNVVNQLFNRSENKVDRSTLPTSYDFEWSYVMQNQSKEGTVNMNYFLKPDATYFAIRPELENKSKGKSKTGDMLIILDNSHNVTISLLQIEDNNFFRATYLPDDEDENENQDYTIEKTDRKTIIGYACQGFKIENNEMIVNMYVAENAPVNFVMRNNNSKNLPKGFNSKWLKEFENGVMMEMEFISKKNKKHNGKMVCISLEKNPYTVNLTEYKSFGN